MGVGEAQTGAGWRPRSLVVLLVLLAALAGAPAAARAAAGPPVVTQLPAGELTEVELSPESLFPGDIAPARGLGAGAWLLVVKGQPGRTFADMGLSFAIDWVSYDGNVAEFPLPRSDYSTWPHSLTPGPLGSVWYLAGGTIGRVSRYGEVTEMPAPTGRYGEGELVVGHDGNLWFTRRDDVAGDAIVRMTPAGAATEFPLPD